MEVGFGLLSHALVVCWSNQGIEIDNCFLQSIPCRISIPFVIRASGLWFSVACFTPPGFPSGGSDWWPLREARVPRCFCGPRVVAWCAPPLGEGRSRPPGLSTPHQTLCTGQFPMVFGLACYRGFHAIVGERGATSPLD